MKILALFLSCMISSFLNTDDDNSTSMGLFGGRNEIVPVKEGEECPGMNCTCNKHEVITMPMVIMGPEWILGGI